MRTVLEHEVTPTVEIDEALKEVQRQMGALLCGSDGTTPDTVQVTTTASDAINIDMITEELDWLFDALRGAADDLEVAFDRIEDDADAPENAVDVATDARITLCTCVSRVEYLINMLRDAFEDDPEDSAPA
jgi:hypothetical protein